MSENESTFIEGDGVVIARGKLKGTTGTVVAVDGDSCAVKLDMGGFVTANKSSLRKPEEPTVTKSRLETVLDQARQEFGAEAPDFILDSLFPQS